MYLDCYLDILEIDFQEREFLELKSKRWNFKFFGASLRFFSFFPFIRQLLIIIYLNDIYFDKCFVYVKKFMKFESGVWIDIIKIDN